MAYTLEGGSLSFSPPVLDDTASPVVAASSPGYSVNPYIAQGIGSALGGIGTGIGNALSTAFGPKTPQQYYPVPQQSSPALPLLIAGGLGLVGLLLVLRRRRG